MYTNGLAVRIHVISPGWFDDLYVHVEESFSYNEVLHKFFETDFVITINDFSEQGFDHSTVIFELFFCKKNTS